MYQDGLGFWTELFKIGTSVATRIGPTLVSALAMRQQQQSYNYQPQTAVSPQPTLQPQTPYPYYPQAPNDTIIRGVPNIAIYGGAALLAVLLITRRN